MRYIDIDRARRQPFQPEPIQPTRSRNTGGSPFAPVLPPLGRGIAVAARMADGFAVAVGGILASLTAVQPADPLAVLAVALIALNVIAATETFLGDAEANRWQATFAAAILAGASVAVSAPLVGDLTGHTIPVTLAWGALATLLVGASRGAGLLLSARLARSNRGVWRILVVGDRDRALEVLATITGAEHRWAFPVGVLLDRDAPSRPVLGGFIAALDDAERFVREEAVDVVVVAVPWSDPERLAACLQKLKPLAVDVHLFPEDAEPFIAGGTSVVAGVPMAKLRKKPLSGASALIKGTEDRVLGGFLLLLAMPVMLAIALAIKLDSSGPVLFRQKRYGYDNLPFTCFKFRSMVVRPEEVEVKQALRDDPRVTRVGRFIRRTSLDELPQLLNVVGGSMSLVGPRPHAVSHHHLYEKLVDDYRCRHRMKPGITGWAQVNGYRGETSTVEAMRKRVVHDLWYIENWSLWLDLLIIARTPSACFKAKNAY